MAESGPGLHDRSSQAVWVWLCLLLMSTGALTGYLIAVGHSYLPSGDLLYGGMEVFLTAAGSGQWPWAFLWQAHNEAHFIPLPKLLFLFDMALTGGSGRLTAAVAALAVIGTAMLMARHIHTLPSLTASERRLFAVFALLLLTSPIVSESLLNPINSQWALLALGTVLIGSGLQSLTEQQGRCGKLLLGSGVLIAWLSGGPWLLIGAAMTAALLLTLPRLQPWQGKIAWLLAGIGLALVGWEVCNGWLLDYRYPPLLVLLYQTLHADPSYGGWQSLQAQIADDALSSHLGWLAGWLGYLAQFSLPPLHRLLALPILIVLFLTGTGLLLYTRRRLQTRHVFLVYVGLFALLLGLSAAVFRAFYPVYTFRQANLGFLLLIAAWVLIHDTAQSRLRRRLSLILVLLYSLLFATVVLRETGPAAAMGPNLLRPAQIALTLDIREPHWPYRAWRHDDGRDPAVLARFRAHRLGAFHAPEYLHFLGERPLPTEEIQCSHRLLNVQTHPEDAQAFYLTGHSQDSNGHTLNRMVITSASGQPVGYGSGRLPSDALWPQLHDPWPWGAWLRLADDTMKTLHITAFDRQRRCQTWILPVPDAAESIPTTGSP